VIQNFFFLILILMLSSASHAQTRTSEKRQPPIDYKHCRTFLPGFSAAIVFEPDGRLSVQNSPNFRRHPKVEGSSRREAYLFRSKINYRANPFSSLQPEDSEPKALDPDEEAETRQLEKVLAGIKKTSLKTEDRIDVFDIHRNKAGRVERIQVYAREDQSDRDVLIDSELGLKPAPIEHEVQFVYHADRCLKTQHRKLYSNKTAVMTLDLHQCRLLEKEISEIEKTKSADSKARLILRHAKLEQDLKQTLKITQPSIHFYELGEARDPIGEDTAQSQQARRALGFWDACRDAYGPASSWVEQLPKTQANSTKPTQPKPEVSSPKGPVVPEVFRTK